MKYQSSYIRKLVVLYTWFCLLANAVSITVSTGADTGRIREEYAARRRRKNLEVGLE